jgi:hypothetical protein
METGIGMALAKPRVYPAADAGGIPQPPEPHYLRDLRGFELHLPGAVSLQSQRLFRSQ